MPGRTRSRSAAASSAPPRHLRNLSAAAGSSYPPELDDVLGAEATATARGIMSAWPGYRETPLRRLAALGNDLGLGGLWCKDESERFGLGSFKALGGPCAVYNALREEIRRRHVGEAEVSVAGLKRGDFRDLTSWVTVCAASAGNHGRAVAWAAQQLGCPCVIYLPSGTAVSRVAGIAEFDARIVRVDGSYDDAVRQAADDASAQGWWLISDTASDARAEPPRWVMQGYTTLADEIARQWEQRDPPSHVFLQCGVGGLAASVCAHFWQRWGLDRPRVIVAEPERAACMYKTARAGRPTSVDGPLETAMTCLACGEVSTVAWEILWRGADDFLTISDQHALDAVRLLRRADRVGPPIRTAPSGASGLGALLAAVRHDPTRRALGVGPSSRVLIIVSEGDGGRAHPNKRAGQ